MLHNFSENIIAWNLGLNEQSEFSTDFKQSLNIFSELLKIQNFYK